MKIRKIHIEIPEVVIIRMVGVAAKDFNGNMSEYVRATIYGDLMKRDLITRVEMELLKDVAE